MKKFLAIVAAVVLAFAIALGDQIVEFNFAGNPLEALKSAFGLFGKEEIAQGKPKLPQVTVKKPEEVNLSYDQRMEKGNYYYDRGFLSYASNEYVKAANLEPERTEPYLRLMKTHYDLMDYERAYNNAEEVLKRESQHFEARYYLALISMKQSDFTKAQERVDELVTNGITDSRVMFLKALLAIANNRHDEGKTLLTAITKDPAADENLKGKVKKILSGYEEFTFAQAAEDIYLSELLARSFNQIGEYELAVYKLKEILKERLDLRDAWSLLGFAYLNLEEHLFALSAFERAYEIDPSSPAIQYFLGITYAALGQNDKAILYLNNTLENGFEPRAAAQQKLADVYLEDGNYEQSVKEYEKVLETSRQDINAFVRPIWLYLDFLNQPEKALKLGELAVLSFPEDPMAYNLLGWSQAGMQNYTEAEKNLKKAISSGPTLAAPHYNLAKMYEDTKRNNEALEHYQKAYELDQNGSIGNLAAKRYNALLLK